MATTIEKQKVKREGNEVTHMAFVGLAYQGKDISCLDSLYSIVP
jgi:hypothetical protein